MAGRVFRVPAIPNLQFVDNCVFHFVLPADPHNCPKPGVIVEFVLFMLGILQKNPRLRFVPASGFSQSDLGPNDTSVIGLLWRRQADLSLPYMALTHQRAKLLPYATPLDKGQISYLVKRQSNHPLQLDLLRLYPKPLQLYGALMLLFCLLRKASRSFVASRLNERLQLVLGLSLAVLLGCLGSQVAVVFNQPRPAQNPIESLEELAEATESKEFTAVYPDVIYFREILNPEHQRGKAKVFDRLIAAYRTNPPVKVKSRSEMVDFIKAAPGDKKYVGIVLGSSLPNHCGLVMAQDPSFKLGDPTIYLSPDWNLSKKFSLVQLYVVGSRSAYAASTSRSRRRGAAVAEQRHRRPDSWRVVTCVRVHSLLLCN